MQKLALKIGMIPLNSEWLASLPNNTAIASAEQSLDMYKNSLHAGAFSFFFLNLLIFSKLTFSKIHL